MTDAPALIAFDGSEPAAAAAQRIAERGVAIARKAGLDATAAVVESGTAWRGLCAVADAQGAGVIVCGSRGQGGISRAMLGSTSSSLLYHAQRPALVAHAWSSPIRRSFTGKSLMGAPLDEIQEVASSLDELFAGEAEEVAA